MATQKAFIKKNILVLGGAGFIGSHLCDALVEECRVICVDNFISGSQENIAHLIQHPNFIFIKADVNSLVSLETIPELERFDIRIQGVQEIYNASCPTSPKDFQKFKIETAHVNSLGVINSLELAVKYRAKYLLLSSSVVYGGRDAHDPFMREDEYRPMSPLTERACYDEGKRFAETLVHTYRERYGIDAKIARPFTTYGPREPIFQGHMIPDFIVAALDGQPLVVYGDESYTMTLCYVSDVIGALLKLMSSVETGPFNIGSPIEYRVVDVARRIIEMTQSSSAVQHEAPLLFMKPLGVPDITRAKEKLDWFPVVTLDDGLAKSIEYTQAHKIIVNWSAVVPIQE